MTSQRGLSRVIHLNLRIVQARLLAETAGSGFSSRALQNAPGGKVSEHVERASEPDHA
jgi:hypothetical protein